MYIEQVNNKHFNPFLYIPIPFLFLGLIVLNFFSTQDLDVDKIMHQMIKTFGVNGTFVLLIGPLSFACVMLLLWVKYIHKQSITSLTTARRKIDWKRIFVSFSIWGAISIASTLIVFYNNPDFLFINYNPEKFFSFLAIAIVLIPLQTSFEEYFFRGYLMQGIGVVTRSKLFPFLFTSIAFGLMHLGNPEVEKMGYIILIYYIGTGLFLGIITLMDDGLELALGFHAANNLIGALLITADWTAFQTHSIFKDVSEPSAGFDVLLPVFVIFPILLYIFSKMYKWPNWKEKLTGKLPFVERY